MKSAEEILQQALRYKRYWGKKGGITVSGGEALLQIDFVTELFTLAKEKKASIPVWIQRATRLPVRNHSILSLKN